MPNDSNTKIQQPTHTTTYQIGNESYTFSTSFHSVTFAKYVRWLNEWVNKFPTEEDELTGEHEAFTDIEYMMRMVSFQTDIPLEILKQIDTANLQSIADTQAFWFSPDELLAVNIVDETIVKAVDINMAPAKFMIEFIHSINALNGDSYLSVMPDCVKNYFDLDIAEKKLSDPVGAGTVYGLATFFLFKLADTGMKSKSLLSLTRQTRMKLRQVLSYSLHLAY